VLDAQELFLERAFQGQAEPHLVKASIIACKPIRNCGVETCSCTFVHL